MKVESIGNNAFKGYEGIGVLILLENNFNGLENTMPNQGGKCYSSLKNWIVELF